MIYTCALQSGSNGNCIYVETADARLLFDAGISGKLAQQRLAHHQREMTDVDALIISHDHSDHVRAAGVFHRKFDLPVYITRKTWAASKALLEPVEDLHHFEVGQALRFGQTLVETIPTAHDGVEGAAFVIHSQNKRLGIFTDLGHRFAGIEQWIATLDFLYLESNYDPQMLRDGPYPAWLKRRIAGDKGHLSNAEAGELVKDSGHRLQCLVLSHLSEHNNRPQLALETVRQIVSPQLPVSVASRTDVSDMFAI